MRIDCTGVKASLERTGCTRVRNGSVRNGLVGTGSTGVRDGPTGCIVNSCQANKLEFQYDM